MEESPEKQEVSQGKTYPNGEHPNSKAHRFKPGQSGNPSGKPKGKMISDSIRDKLRSQIKKKDGTDLGITYLEALLEAVATKAIKRADVRAAELLMEYAEPKPKVLDVAVGGTGEPIPIVFQEITRADLPQENDDGGSE